MVATLRSAPVAALVTVMEVPGTTAPVLSVTRPLMRADWANTAGAKSTKQRAGEQ